MAITFHGLSFGLTEFVVRIKLSHGDAVAGLTDMF